MSKRCWSVDAEWNCLLEIAIKVELTAGHPDKSAKRPSVLKGKKKMLFGVLKESEGSVQIDMCNSLTNQVLPFQALSIASDT